MSLPNTSPHPLPPSSNEESPSLTALISNLNLHPHPEGGYYAETDRSSLRIPNPFLSSSLPSPDKQTQTQPTPPKAAADTAAAVATEDGGEEDDSTRAASTTIFYLLTPASPKGVFHRNKARTMHTLHRGRGQYVIIRPPSTSLQPPPPPPPPSSSSSASSSSSTLANGARSAGGGGGSSPDASLVKSGARIETFTVGHNVAAGERLQWMVEGGLWKSSFLLPSSSSSSAVIVAPGENGAVKNGRNENGAIALGGGVREEEEEEDMLLISETVVPGFEFRDHDFLTRGHFEELVKDEEGRGEWGWLVRREG